MIPTLKPDQEVIVSSLPYLFLEPKTGDIIAFREGEKFIVKRINLVKSNKYFVKGDNQKDSKDYGWIEKNKIIGKVVYKAG